MAGRRHAARHGEPARRPRRPRAGDGRGGSLLGSGAEQFANRLHKNRRQFARLVRREELECYRLYDADLPDYNVAVDVYGDHVVVQEYAAPAYIEPEKAARRLREALAVVAAELQCPVDDIVLKQRRRQRGAAQYEHHDEDTFAEVGEDGMRYLVNLTGYVDTGLFIDQRLTRRLVRRLAAGRRFLNLFAYTGTMTVNALAGGAPASTTVDLSGTYLDWAGRNLAANGFAAADAGPHRLVRADVLEWIGSAEGGYDLVWLDPPTFSNSRRMGHVTFDVQRDHADLVRMVAPPPAGAGRHPAVRHQPARLHAGARRAAGPARARPLARHAGPRLRARRQSAPRVRGAGARGVSRPFRRRRAVLAATLPGPRAMM